MEKITQEQVYQIVDWLDELNYSHLELNQAVSLFEGEFGHSLLWLSLHLIGRRSTAHVKTELHRLRETAGTKLSSSKREELGLNLLELAARDNLRLQREDQRVSRVILESIDLLKVEERKKSTITNECLKDSTLLGQLRELKGEHDDETVRIDAMRKLIEEWKSSFLELNKENSARSIIETTQRVLRHSSESLEILPRTAASQNSLKETAVYQLGILEELSELSSRHMRIRPPPVRIERNTLQSLRQHCIRLDKRPPIVTTTTSSDKRQVLIESIIKTRERRKALELSVTAEPVTTGVDQDQLLLEATSAYENLKISTQEVLQLRSNLGQRILSLKTELISQTPIENLQAQLLTQKSTTIPSLNSNISSLLTNHQDKPEPISPLLPFTSTVVTNNDMNLVLDVTRALKTVHLLNNQLPLSDPITKAEVGIVCDAIAESRFALEYMRPSLQLKLDTHIETKRLEELAEIRYQFTEGKLLPSVKLSDGKTLAERFKKLERESNRKQIL